MSILLAGNKIGVIPMKTEEEIMKGLAACGIDRCDDCPFYDEDEWKCNHNLPLLALDLLKKQQAEINRLKKYDEERDIRLHARLITNAKNEAIREFVERLKEMKYESIEWSHGKHPYVVEESDIDNLVEEMAGDK